MDDKILRKTLLVIAIYVNSGLRCSARSNLLIARMLGTVFHQKLRAHSDRAVHNQSNAWMRIEEVPEVL